MINYCDILITSAAAQASGKGAAPAVAEGLGGVNIKGVEDPKTEGRPGEQLEPCSEKRSLRMGDQLHMGNQLTPGHVAGPDAREAVQPISDRLHEGNAPGATKK